MTKGEIDALIAEAREYLDAADQIPEQYVNDPITVIGGINIMRRLADALSLLGDGAGDSSSSRDHAPGAGSALEKGLAACGVGVPYGDYSVGETASLAAYSVLRCCDLIRAGDWRVPRRIGSVTQEMDQSRINRSSAKQAEGEGS